MPSDGDSAYPALLAKIRQLEDEAGRLRLLIAELLVKNQQLRETGVEPQAPAPGNKYGDMDTYSNITNTL